MGGKKPVIIHDTISWKRKRKCCPSAIILHYISASHPDYEKISGKYGYPGVRKILEDFHLSYHYIVDREGRIYHLVDDEYEAYHAGKSELHGVTGCNKYTIGVSLIGDGKTPFTKEQYDATIHVCANKAAMYNIPLYRIVGHEHISHKLVREDPKVDPGPNFNWNYFLIEVAKGIINEK